ncbi:MAG: DUF5658 family protein [bacterium]
MLLLLAYALMLHDLIMTLLVHEDAGELNPLWVQSLDYDSTAFIYGKIAISAAIALGLLWLYKVRPTTGQWLTILAVVVYGLVGYIHWEVWRATRGEGPLIPAVVERVDDWTNPVPVVAEHQREGQP